MKTNFLDKDEILLNRKEKRNLIQGRFLNLWIENNLNGFGLLSVGLGKSKIIIDALNYIYDTKEIWEEVNKASIPILILVNSTYLRDEGLLKEFDIFNLREEIKEKVRVECYQAVYKWNKKDVGIMLADELDFALSKEYSKTFDVKRIGRKYFLGLSGTVEDDRIELLNSFTNILCWYPVDKAQKEGIVNETKIIIHKVPLDTTKNIEVEYTKNGKKQKFYTSEQEQYKYIQKAIKKHIITASNYKKEIDKKWKEYFANNKASHIISEIKVLEAKQAREWKNKERIESGLGNKSSRLNFLYSLKSTIDYSKKLKEKLLKEDNNKIVIFSKFTDCLRQITDYCFVQGEEEDLVDRFNRGEFRDLGVIKKANRGISFEGANHCIAQAYSSNMTDFIQGLKGRMTRLNIDEENKTAYIHILVSTYKEEGKETFCQNYNWVKNFLDEQIDIDKPIYVSNLNEIDNIIK